jgi:predicted amidohydrolase YtcJ
MSTTLPDPSRATTLEADLIEKTRVRLTMVDGRVVYEAEK